MTNLLVNAIQASEGGSEITVVVRREDTSAIIEVIDHGAGIADEDLSRVVEPFFTKKRVGEGTGLGLAMVYGLVRQSGGAVTVESEPGRGARFRVLLPARVRSATPSSPASRCTASMRSSMPIWVLPRRWRGATAATGSARLRRPDVTGCTPRVAAPDGSGAGPA